MPSAQRPHPVPVVLVAAALLLTLAHAATTQFVAYKLAWSDQLLGEALMVDEHAGIKFYAPWKFYAWSSLYAETRAAPIFSDAWKLLGATSLVSLLLPAIGIAMRKEDLELDSHGSARWQSEDQIKASGLLDTPKQRLEQARKKKEPRHAAACVVVGKHPEPLKEAKDGIKPKSKHYYSSGKEHVLLFAPTRSGKGVGAVIPGLLTWLESVVVLDIKAENFLKTGWWRSQFSHVIYFNPTDPNSARYNPMLEIERGDRAIAEAQNLAVMLNPFEGKSGDNQFWDEGARTFMAAVILYVLYTQPVKSLGTCARYIADIENTLSMLAHVEIPENPAVQAYIHLAANTGLNASESVCGGWAASAAMALKVFTDPIIDKNTSHSDFFARELQYAKNPLSLYLVVPPNQLERLQPLMRIMFQMFNDTLTQSLDEANAHTRHRLLMLCDEFPALGKVSKIESAIGYTAGYDIRWMFICQGLDQLDRIYGPNNSFLAGCHTRMSFVCQDEKNARRLSALCGKTTRLKEQEGAAGQKGLLASLSRRSISYIEFERDLITPDELMTLPDHEMILLQGGQHPIRCHKITYYDDPDFFPKYKNKELTLPTTPLTDFPSSTYRTGWEDSSIRATAPLDQGAPEVDITKLAKLVENAIDRGEFAADGIDVGAELEQSAEARAWNHQERHDGSALVSPPVEKLPGQVIENISKSIPANLTPEQASSFVATQAIATQDIVRAIQANVERGVISQANADELLANIQRPVNTTPPPPPIEPPPRHNGPTDFDVPPTDLDIEPDLPELPAPGELSHDARVAQNPTPREDGARTQGELEDDLIGDLLSDLSGPLEPEALEDVHTMLVSTELIEELRARDQRAARPSASDRPIKQTDTPDEPL